MLHVVGFFLVLLLLLCLFCLLLLGFLAFFKSSASMRCRFLRRRRPRIGFSSCDKAQLRGSRLIHSVALGTLSILIYTRRLKLSFAICYGHSSDSPPFVERWTVRELYRWLPGLTPSHRVFNLSRGLWLAMGQCDVDRIALAPCVAKWVVPN